MAQLCPTLLIVTLISALFASSSFAESPDTPNSKARAESTADDYGTPKTIGWSKLAPENGKPFNDPFSKLTCDQLADVSYVVRVRRLVAEEKIEANGDDAKEAARIGRKLEKQGVDIGWLMVQRQRVRQIRGLQVEQLSKTIARSLGDREIVMTGYVMPITVDRGQVTEFFLVPTVAACSHEAAPLPLQVVYVSTDEGFAAPDKATPVHVTGIINASSETRTKMSASGKTTVRSAYTMLSPAVETYAQAHR